MSDWPPVPAGDPEAGGSNALIAIAVPAMKPRWDDCLDAARNKARGRDVKIMAVGGMPYVHT